MTGKIEVYFFEDKNNNSIEVRKQKDGKYDITLYGFYEAGYAYDITKDKLRELRDRLNEMVGDED
jgi:hypothetical protein